MDIVISHLNFNSTHHDKCKFSLILIPLVTTSNLFSLEVVQKMPTLPTLCNTGKTRMAKTSPGMFNTACVSVGMKQVLHEPV